MASGGGSVKELRSQRSDVLEAKNNRLSWVDMWALGISIVIGGQYFSWNAGVFVGFGSYVIAFFVVSTAYLCLVCSVAELSSGLPFAGKAKVANVDQNLNNILYFAGGTYGISRATAGVYLGYMAGCFDVAKTIMYVSASVLALSAMMSELCGTSQDMDPVWSLLFYVVSVIIQVAGNEYFWTTNMILAWVSFLLVVVFILGGLKYANFDEHASLEHRSGQDKWFAGGMAEFMHILPLPMWFYIGVEYISLASQDVNEPKEKIPKGYVWCFGTLVATAILVLFVACSIPPGISELSSNLAPFGLVYSRIFSMSSTMAIALSIPATFATSFGFIFCYSRQIRSMGNSGLLNPWLGKSTPKVKTPMNALIVGSIVSYLICLLVHYKPNIGVYLFNVCVIMAVSMYIFQFVSYIVFQGALRNIKREFRSPLGLFGAIYGLVTFSFIGLAAMFFQEDGYVALIVYLVFVGVCTIYYCFVVVGRQYFSKEEKEVLFAAHLTKSKTF